MVVGLARGGARGDAGRLSHPGRRRGRQSRRHCTRANRLQTSLNLALGSALASIGLTIPTVAVVAIGFGLPLQLGLGAKEQVLLAVTIVLGVITLGTGRTTVLQGIVHLSVFATFIFFALIP